MDLCLAARRKQKSLSPSDFVQFLSDHESKISNEILYKSMD
jgi:hypothetical protein